MDIASKVEKLADVTDGNFKLTLAKVVLGSTAGFLATAGTQKLIDVIAKTKPSTIVKIVQS